MSMCSNLKPSQQNEQESPSPNIDDSVKILVIWKWKKL